LAVTKKKKNQQERGSFVETAGLTSSFGAFAFFAFFAFFSPSPSESRLRWLCVCEEMLVGALIFFLFFPNLECESSGAAFDLSFPSENKAQNYFYKKCTQRELTSSCIVKEGW